MAGLRNALSVEFKDLRTQVAASFIGATLWGIFQAILKAVEEAGKHIGGLSVLANAPFWLSVPAAFVVIFLLSWGLVLGAARLRPSVARDQPPHSTPYLEALAESASPPSPGALRPPKPIAPTVMPKAIPRGLLTSSMAISGNLAGALFPSMGLYSKIKKTVDIPKIKGGSPSFFFESPESINAYNAECASDVERLRQSIGENDRSDPELDALIISGPRSTHDLEIIAKYLVYLETGQRWDERW